MSVNQKSARKSWGCVVSRTKNVIPKNYDAKVQVRFNKLQLSPKIPVYLNEVQFCECLLSSIYVNEGTKEKRNDQ